MTRPACLATALAILLAMSVNAFAQAPAPSAQAPALPVDPQACTPQERSNPALNNQQGPASGVICPPDIDPAIRSPAPDLGKMPVISPPGRPGGDPTVQPK